MDSNQDVGHGRLFTIAVTGLLVGGLIGYYIGFLGSRRVNHKVAKDKKRVVNTYALEDIEDEQSVFCRCWKSAKFPYCDGSHVAHNAETGDNVGPLIIKRRGQSS